MKILVTGATGFIGLSLIQALARDGVRVLVREPFVAPKSWSQFNVEVFYGDFLEPGALKKALEGVGQLVHLAATTVPVSAERDPIRNIQENLVGSVRLFQLALESGVHKIVFSSSGGTVYGDVIGSDGLRETSKTNPKSPYGIAKLATEQHLGWLCAQYDADWLCLRVSNPYGIHQTKNQSQGLIGISTRKIYCGETLDIWGDGSIVRDYVYVEDVAEAMCALIDKKVVSGVYNIGSGTGTSILEIVELIGAAMHKAPIIRYQDGRSIDVGKSVVDICKIRDAIGWSPNVDLRQGIQKVVEEYLGER